jgi:hypothetical protein
MALGICGVAAAQAPSWARGTWPPITVNVTMENGWVVATGNVDGAIGPALWKSALAPAGPPIAVHQGVLTTFVEVGPRRFVVDDASGRATELGGGAVYRQWGPPWAAPPPPPPPNVVPATSSQPPSLTPAQREALQIAAVTQNRLQAAMEHLEKLTATEPSGSAALADAKLAVQATRIDVSLGMARVKDEFGSAAMPAIAHPSPQAVSVKAAAVASVPRPLSPPQPAGPPVAKEEAQSHDRLLQAQADLQTAIMGVHLLRTRSAPPAYIADASDRLPALQQAEEDALVAFRKSQLEADIRRLGDQVQQMDLASRFELYEDLYRVLGLTRDRYRAEAALRILHAEEAAAGGITLEFSLRFDRAAANLAQTIMDLESARKDFAALPVKGGVKQADTSAQAEAMATAG